MTDLYLLDPDVDPAWYPYQDGRPVAELRAGVWLVRERWEAIVDGEARAIFAPPHLHDYAEEDVPPVGALEPVDGPALIGRSAFAPTGIPPELGNGPARLVHEDEVVGWWVPAGARWEGPDFAGEDIEIDGLRLLGAFDLLTALEHFLVADVADFTREAGDRIPDGCLVIGDPHDVVLLGATVEPGVVFDVREGAVVIEQHTYVRSGTRLEGPLYVGPGSAVLGGPIGWSAIGPRCKVRGELSHAVFLGYANKTHDGFVGHSVLGRWANLGAGTITSNLKNTYGNVRLDLPSGRVETGRQYLGTLLGDHAKTAIGTMLGTGTVVGIGANVFGPVRPPKLVRPFAWGMDGATMELDGFLTIAARVLPRRNVELTPELRTTLERIYQHATGA